MKLRLLSLLCGAAFAATASGRAAAATTCVDSVDALVDALGLAASTAQSDEIRIEQGTYLLAGRTLDHSRLSSGALRFTGGWNDGCASQSLAAGNTTLDGGGSAWADLAGSGSVEVAALTMKRFVRRPFSQFAISFAAGEGERLRVHHMAMVENIGPVGVSSIAEWNVHDSLIARNVGPDVFCAIVESFPGGTRAAPGRFVHNTVADNSGPACFIGTRHVVIANNIFWSQDGTSQLVGYAFNDPSRYAANLYASPPSGSMLPESRGNRRLDPKFLDPANGDYRLANDSPAINAGIHGVPGGISESDLLLQSRAVGHFPDLGAYESAITPPFEYFVSNANDAGPGSLRAAIGLANGGGQPARIRFAIGASCGPHIVTLASALPQPTVPLVVDGFSQPGAQGNNRIDGGWDGRPCVVLRAPIAGLASAWTISGAAPPLAIRGLAFDDFDFAALNLRGGYGHSIEGNQFGGTLDASGIVLAASNIAVQVALDARIVSIGGAPIALDPAPVVRARANWFADSVIAAVALSSTDGRVHVGGNVIGSRLDDPSDYGATTGVRVVGSGHRVHGNFINGHDGDGVALVGTGDRATLVDGNRIGVVRIGSAPNNGAGVHVLDGASGAVVGWPGAMNTIGTNAMPGIWFESGSANRASGNRLFSNGKVSGRNIDLSALGIDANDAGDADTGGGNERQNRAVGVSMSVDAQRQVRLDLSVASTSTFDLELVATKACNSADVDADYTFYVERDISPANGGIQGRFIGVLADDLPSTFAVLVTTDDGTSELSDCVVVPQGELLSDGFETEG